MKPHFEFLIFPFVLILLLSCDEPFPQYSEPANVLAGSVTLVAPDTIDVFSDMSGWYVNTPLILNINVINMHDDLLQGEALVGGLLTVQSFSEIPRTMTVPLTNGNLRTPPVFQGNIAVAPGDTAIFSLLWLPIVDGTIVFQGLPANVVGGKSYYGPIDFQPSVEVQLFERVQPIRFVGEEFSLVFRDNT